MLNALKYTLYWRILIVFFHTKKFAHRHKTLQSGGKKSSRWKHLFFHKSQLPEPIYLV